MATFLHGKALARTKAFPDHSQEPAVSPLAKLFITVSDMVLVGVCESWASQGSPVFKT